MLLGIASGIRSLKQKHHNKLNLKKHVFSVVVDTPAIKQEDILRKTVAQHDKCIRLLAKESKIRICSSADAASDSEQNTNMVTEVVSPQIKVVGFLNNAGETDPAVIEKIQAELASIRRVTLSEGYLKKAPEAVKQADK
ncbi:hypothetical protein GGI05_000797 [Coemansia sp. RSA 2603]|nr:hypothetical protein GGI05_000797 [Coemansia sp. RSA 2603]